MHRGEPAQRSKFVLRRSVSSALVMAAMGVSHACAVPPPLAQKEPTTVESASPGGFYAGVSIYGTDDRITWEEVSDQRIRTLATGVGSIAPKRVSEVPAQGRCTAFLVAADKALTARHCVSPSEDLWLRLGDWEEGGVASPRIRAYRIEAILTTNREAAIALVRLSRDAEGFLAGQRFRVLELEKRQPVLGENVYAFGYPAKDFLRVGECSVVTGEYLHPTGIRTFGTDCDSGPGYAGAPVLSAKSLRVVGVIWGGRTDVRVTTKPGPSAHEFVAPVAALIPRLNQWLSR